MPTQGQVNYFNANINTGIALTLVGSVALGVALIVWHAAVGNNPIADFMVNNDALRAALQ